MEVCSQINNYYFKKSQKDKDNLNHYKVKRVIPFFKRKQLCFNYEKLNESNTNDMDKYCINLNKSSIEDISKKCIYYKNIIENKHIINIDNNKNISNIPFECKNLNEQINILFSKEICPFYFYLNKIINDDYDIIICERDYFLDNKKNISIRKVIDFDDINNTNKFLLVFDEYNDIDDYLVKINSCIITESLLNLAEYRLLQIEDIPENQNNKKMAIPNDKVIQNTPETEIIRYNLLHLKVLLIFYKFVLLLQFLYSIVSISHIEMYMLKYS